MDQQFVADSLLQRFLATSASYLALPLAAARSGEVLALIPQRMQRDDTGCEVSDVCLPRA